MLLKTYDPAAVETRIYDAWQAAGAFKAGAGARPGAKPFTIVIPPPNVTGSLHIGHALNNTLQDILIRFERLRGKNVLWQPGTDHAGIATQMVVERQLAARQLPRRRDMGREKFLETVWEWKAESGGTIAKQLQRLGASADWSRERFTMDEGLSAAVRRVFVELHAKGLIYRAKRLVNWHPGLETAVSDLEVENIETDGKMWRLAYPLENGGEIIVATTRPETMFGDVAVAVHPDDERYRHLIGQYAILPVAGRRIPIIGDDYADPALGSGAVKITPAHDFNDFEVGARHGLEPINIFTPTASLNEAVPAAYRGLDRFEARQKLLAELEARGVLAGVDEKKIMIPFDEKSKLVVIEPYLTDQWFVRADILAAPALAAVRDGRTKFVPKTYENTFYAWMENIKPWCISRQLWWGHQIPAWYGPDGACFVAESAAEAVAKAEIHYGAPTPLTRDEDVLDTWFSSALWPFSTLGWPGQTPELETYYPTSVLVTGFDIIFFWVARMMMTALEFTGTVPFHTVYLHALVRDEKGQKMSKTKGNVIDPLKLIDEYGADATRFTLAAMAAQGRDMRLALARVEGYRNFVTKLWNAARFLEMNGCARVDGFDPAAGRLALNRWIVAATARAVAAVTAALEEFKFNEAANAAYDFVWGIFCDWYLELAKPVFDAEDVAAKAETQATAAFVLDQILALLHPFMPFVTEELWGETGKAGPARATLLILADWPELKNFTDPAAEAELDWLIALVSAIRSVRQEMNVPAGAKVALAVVGAGPASAVRLADHRAALLRLARLESIAAAAAIPPGSAQIILGEAVFALPLAGIIDLDAERARLEKEMGRETEEMDKVDKKLANSQFTAKAPPEVIAEQAERRLAASRRRDRLAAALARLD